MHVKPEPSVWVTILAGGAGHRFWPLSTPERPKQLLPLASSQPLILDTIERVRGFVPGERLRVLAGEDLVEPIRGATGLGRESFMVETRARGTGPVLARAAWEIERADPGAIMVSLHSDHMIEPVEAFRDVLAAAVDIAHRDRLLLAVAAPPDRPETGYGYIRPGEALPAPAGHRAYRVGAFVEKPGPTRAARYVEEGCRWNTGIFVWAAGVFLQELERCAPEITCALPHLETGDTGAFFEATARISVDEAVLERSERVACIDASFRWDDVGSWESLARNRPVDERGNVIEGEVHLSGSADNIALAGSGRLALLGVRDLLVVQTEHVTLVMPRSESPRLKEYLQGLPPRLLQPASGRGPDSPPG
ncbi:MAG: mannose-1-phosphate guanylyltransferase [Gemmatimonadetes bacterium]|nr:mannose-1-phosphate guanylyltransferase [Gemmatimonadota bacterium]MYC00013.1 mannose-1-phosphate guanylyltransferase [Gemmatimonadota bacterium]MYI45055.1 mannose-1-phosphate guanylyltransferase [Gemmatimonadota bacterium]